MSNPFRIGVTPLRISEAAHGFKRINLSPYQRVWPGRADPIKDEIIERASRFNYLDQKGDIFTDLNRNEIYMKRLTTFWGLPYLRLDLKADLWNGKKNAEFTALDWNLLAFGISCKGDYSSFKKGDVIWEGYKDENNLRDKFIPQFIDDSSEEIERINMDTFGVMEIQLRDRPNLDPTSLIHFAAAFAIMQNIRILEFR